MPTRRKAPAKRRQDTRGGFLPLAALGAALLSGAAGTFGSKAVEFIGDKLRGRGAPRRRRVAPRSM